MDDTYNPILAAASGTTPVPGETDNTPEPYNPIAAAASGNPHEYTRPLVEQATRDQWDWGRLSSGLAEVGARPEDYAHLKPHADLAEAKRKLAAAEGRGESASQVFRRKFMGFGSLTSLDSLPDISTGGRFFGGKVVGEKEHYTAQQNFQAGRYADSDLETIARYQNQQRTDQVSKEAAKKSEAWSLLSEVAGLGKVVQEGAVGGALFSKAAKLAGSGRAAATATGVPGVPAAESLGAYAKSRIAPTVYTPSMWLPQMQQNNLANGRDPNDLKGAPSAVAYGYANMLVLGKLQKGLDSPTVGNAIRKGVSASAELQLVDAAAGVADEFLPKAYKIKPTGEGNYGTVGQWVKAYKAGDSDKASETLRDATIQALGFAVFAGAHSQAKPETMLSAYADAVGKLRGQGLSERAAGDRLYELHTKLQDALDADRFLSRDAAAEAIKDMVAPETKPYADKLVEAFQPEAKPKTEPDVATVATEPPVGPKPEAKPIAELPAHAETARERADKLHAEAADISSRLTAARLAEGRLRSRGDEAQARAKAVEVGRLKLAHADKTAEANAAETDYRASAEAASRRIEELGQEAQELTTKIRSGRLALDGLNSVARGGGKREMNAAAKALEKYQGLRDQHQRTLNAIENLKAGKPETPPPRVATVVTQPTIPATPQKVALPSKAPSRPKDATPSETAPDPTRPEIASPDASQETQTPPQTGASNKTRRQRMMESIARAGGGSASPTEPPSSGVATVATPEEASRPERLGPSYDFVDPETMRGKTIATFMNGVERSGVPKAVQKEHQKRIGAFLDKAPDYVKRSLAKNLSGVKAYAGLPEVSGAVAAEGVAMAGRNLARANARLKAGVGSKAEVADAEKSVADAKGAQVDVMAGRGVLAGTVTFGGELFIDGGGDLGFKDSGKYAVPQVVTAEAVLAHELAHLVDFRRVHSDNPQWKAAYESEIVADAKTDARLSEYARTDSNEGFAEFFRLVHESDVPHRQIEREFPKSAEFFKERGLWPDAEHLRDSGSGKTPIQTPIREQFKEQFNEKIPQSDGSHADAVSADPKVTTVATGPAFDIKADWESRDHQDARDALASPDYRRDLIAAGVDVGKELAAKNREFKGGNGSSKDVGVTHGNDGGLSEMADVLAAIELPAESRRVLDHVVGGGAIGSYAKMRAKAEGTDPARALDAAGKAGGRAVKKIVAEIRSRLEEKLKSAGGEEADRIRATLDAVSGEKAKNLTLNKLILAIGRGRALSAQASARGVVEGKDVGYGPREGEASFFGGYPLAVKFVSRVRESLFGRRGGSDRTALDRVKTALLGDLPPEVREAKARQLGNAVASYAFDVDNATRDLKRAMSGAGMPYEKVTPDVLQHLDSVLRGEKLYRPGVPAPVLEVLDSMRAQVDKLSRLLADSGAVKSPLKAVIDENMGSYLTRQYEVFRDPKWFAKVDPEVRNRFESWLAQELATKYQGPVDPAEVSAETEKLLKNGTAAENPIAFLSHSRLGGKDVSILRARKELPPELRALWGEVQDPLVNYTQSVGQLAHLVSTHEFLTTVAREGRNKFLFDTPTGDHIHELGSPESETLKPLAGLHTTLEIKKAFEESFSRPQLSGGMRLYMKAVAAAKLSKTVLNHAGHLRNFLSNVGIAVRNGHWDVRKLPESFRSLAADTPAARSYWRDLVSKGVVGHEINYNDFKETVKDAFKDRDAYRDGHEFGVLGKLYHHMLKGPVEFAAKWYRYGDTFWKVYGYENERASYENAGLSPQEASAKAARVISDTTPTYSRMAKGLQNLRRFPLVGPFVSFQAEVVRTTANTVRLALTEMRDANPNVRSLGAKRFAGLAAAGTMGWAIAAWSRAQLGISAGEDDDVRRFLPENQKNARLVYTGRDSKGQPQYTDFSKLDPNAYLADAVIGAVRGKDAAESAKFAVEELVKPFVGEELLLRPALDIARNQKEPGGQVYNPEDRLADQAGDVLQHAGKAFSPGGAGPVRRAAMGYSGTAEQKSGKGYAEESAVAENLAGVRVQSVRVEDELSNKAHEFARRKRDAERAVNELIRAKGVVTPDELKAARDRSEESLNTVFQDFKRDVDAAERLHVPKETIARILIESGLPVQDFGYLYGGARVPYLPQITGTAQSRVRAGSVRTMAGQQVAGEPPR